MHAPQDDPVHPRLRQVSAGPWEPTIPEIRDGTDDRQCTVAAPGCRARAQADVGGMPQPERHRAEHGALRVFPVSNAAPVLDPPTRQRLGRQLRALYDPVIDEPLDPRLADLLRQLDADRAGEA